MIILIKTLQLVLSLSILVIIHEFGHFLAARVFKIRVEKFYLFFDPWFSLFKFKKGETEYGIGWLPLGGYVKIAGMIDESMDKEQMLQPAQPYEFRSKPAWQRLIVMVAGVFFNIILAIGIYIATLSVWGEAYLPSGEVKYGITVDSVGAKIGLRDGDKILTLDNEKVEDFFKIPSKIILDKPKTIQVIRDGQKMDIQVPENIVATILKHQSADFINVRVPFEIAELVKNSAAQAAGIKVGDKIIGVDTVSTPYFHEFKREIVKYKNKETSLKILRNNDTLKLVCKVSSAGTIGVANKSFLDYFTVKERKYSLLQAIPAGCVKAYKGVGNYWKQLKLIFNPETKAYKQVGSFISIGKMFGSSFDWPRFWDLTAFLSIMLAVLNIIPIPALDGGHVMFTLFEIITGRKPSDKFLEYAQIVGMLLLLGLVILAFGNDIINYVLK
jgi:regulator of sigma E protease